MKEGEHNVNVSKCDMKTSVAGSSCFITSLPHSGYLKPFSLVCLRKCKSYCYNISSYLISPKALARRNVQGHRHTHKPVGEGELSGTALSYGLDDRGFESLQGLVIFLFTTAYRPSLLSKRYQGLLP
jgi:hypothetical protein